MSAGINDKFADTYNAANPNVARVTSTRAAAASSLACDNLSGWPTNTVVHFSTYKIDTSNKVVAGSQIDWEGIVSGTSIGTMTRITGAADAGNAVGDVVEMNPTAKWASNLVNGILVQHNQDGTHGAITSTNATLTTPTLTSPKVVTAINDTNGNALWKVTATASAVNQFTNANAATGSGPTLSATGTDTNIDINITPKGSGSVTLPNATLSGAALKDGTVTPKQMLGIDVLGYTGSVNGSPPTAGTGQFYFQCGTTVLTTNGSGEQTITLPSAFPNGILSVVVCGGNASVSNQTIGVMDNSNSASTFSIHSSVISGAVRINWIAIGF